MLAYVTFEDVTYFSKSTPVYPERHDKCPHSATTQLIQGIWESYPKNALLILRQPIFTDEPPTPLVQGVVKIAAKRMRAISSEEASIFLASQSTRQEIIFTPRFQPPEIDFQHLRTPQQIAKHLATLSLRNSPSLHKNDRAVGAVLVSKDNQILALAHNTNAKNRTLHAEVNLVQWWWQTHKRPLPAGSRLITSLEPCKMCVGMVTSCLEAPHDFRLEYLENDRGPAVRQDWFSTHKLQN